jgi:hypothetical protein
VAVRLLDGELEIAAAALAQVIEGGAWLRVNLERGRRTWDQYRGDAALMLSADEWRELSSAFYGRDAMERRFAELAPGTEMDDAGRELVEETLRRALRRLARPGVVVSAN